MIGHWGALYQHHYNYTGVLWNIQRKLQHIHNINFDTQIDESNFSSFMKYNLFVHGHLVSGRHLGFSIGKSGRMGSYKRSR